MAEWRLKAYELFGFQAGSYSQKWGVVRLFDDLLEMARRAVRNSEPDVLQRIVEYAIWADSQTAENLRSAADIEFFMPVLRDPELRHAISPYLPNELIDEKSRLIEPSSS